MIYSIFRAILILAVISIVLAVIVTIGGTFNIGISFAINEFLRNVLAVCVYVVPFGALLPIFAAVVSLTLFKITVSILKTVWDVFPFRP